MNLYAETSAVVSWLLDEERGDRARSHLAAAASVSTSDLTLIECDRTLRRAAFTGGLTAGESSQIQTFVDTASAHWTLHGMDAEIVHRSPAGRFLGSQSGRSTPSILQPRWAVRNLFPDVRMLSLDERIRDNAAALGFDVVPR